MDGLGRTLTIQQWDTFLNGVPPLDRNRLTREWFHTGKAVYSVDGPKASEFEGTLELGYQVSFPWSAGVGLHFGYTTPNLAFWGGDFGEYDPVAERLGLDLIPGINTPPLLPALAISSNLGNGPGIIEIATFSTEVSGAQGRVAAANAHGTITGAAGGVLLRPFARLIGAAGESVVTYGDTWNMN